MLNEPNFIKRIIMAFLGTILTGFCVGCLQKADLGVDPFTCLVTGCSNLFQSTYSAMYIIITGILLFFAFVINRKLIGIATILNLLIVGICADFMRNILDMYIPEPDFYFRSALLLVSIILVSLSAALYFSANLGVSAYDAIALNAADKYKISKFKTCRIICDCSCVLIGLICSVTIGIGTILTAFFMGPIIQWFRIHVSDPLVRSYEKN